MEATPRYMGLNDFVEELSRHLVQVEMVPAPRTQELLRAPEGGVEENRKVD